MGEIRQQIRRIASFPNSYPLIDATHHRANLHRFPSCIIYRILPAVVEITAIFPDRRDPDLLSRHLSSRN